MQGKILAEATSAGDEKVTNALCEVFQYTDDYAKIDPDLRGAIYLAATRCDKGQSEIFNCTLFSSYKFFASCFASTVKCWWKCSLDHTSLDRVHETWPCHRLLKTTSTNRILELGNIVLYCTISAWNHQSGNMHLKPSSLVGLNCVF